MEGWLQKKPETSIIYFQFGEILSWKTRYFVHDGFYLKYFKSETKQELLGQIDLQTVSDLRESKAFCGNGGYYGFELVTPKRVYCLVGTEEQVIIKWLNSLRLSIQTPITSINKFFLKF